MHPNIKKLYQIASKTERRILGVNCGTSLDGLDIVYCTFRGSGLTTKVEIIHFETVDYSNEIKTEIRKVFAKRTIEFEDKCLLNSWIGTLNGEMILDCLAKRGILPSEVDVIASHGQTVFHAPKSAHGRPGFANSTLQIGDGDHIAVKTGILTMSDFRQKHVAAGGEGAPLAIYADYVLFAKKDENRILLNIGGIANFSYLPGISLENLVASDTGPGNTLIDAFCRLHFNRPYDKDGEIASSGEVHKELLAELRSDQFFIMPFPKSTGPELFNVDFVLRSLTNCGLQDGSIRPADLIATLTKFTAETIHDGIRACIPKGGQCPLNIYTSGGGNHNGNLMKRLTRLFPEAIIHDTNALGIPGDAKEAVLFAALANEALCGDPATFEGGGKHMPNVSMGKISFPN